MYEDFLWWVLTGLKPAILEMQGRGFSPDPFYCDRRCSKDDKCKWTGKKSTLKSTLVEQNSPKINICSNIQPRRVLLFQANCVGMQQVIRYLQKLQNYEKMLEEKVIHCWILHKLCPLPNSPKINIRRNEN